MENLIDHCTIFFMHLWQVYALWQWCVHWWQKSISCFLIELRSFNYFARCIKRFMHEQLSWWSEFQADTVSFISLKLYLILWKRNNILWTLDFFGVIKTIHSWGSKGIPTLSVRVNASKGSYWFILCKTHKASSSDACHDAWKSVPDPFPSVNAAAAVAANARCGYAFTSQH